MKKIRGSLACKAVAWIAFAALSFAGIFYALQAVTALYYAAVEPEDWQSSYPFENMLCQKAERLAEGAAVQSYIREQSGLSYVKQRQLQDELARVKEEFDPAVTNYRVQIKSADGKEVLAGNVPQGENLEHVVEQVHYATFREGERHVEFYGAGLYWSDVKATTDSAESTGTGRLYVIECGVAAEPDPTVQDAFYQLWYQIHEAQNCLAKNGLRAGLFLGMAVLWLIWLLWSAGYKTGRDEPGAAWQDRLFLEAYLVLAALALILPTMLWAELLNEFEYRVMNLYQDMMMDPDGVLILLGISAGLAATVVICAMVLCTLTVRLKTHTLARSVLITRAALWLWRGGKEFLNGLPMTWKTLALCGTYLFLTLIFYSYGRYNGFWCFLWFAASAVGMLYLGWWAMSFCRLRQGGKAMATGNLNHRVDTHRMPLDLKSHGEDLNNISAGLANAVEEQMKSERFKAELITNVSHDLKTPLTTIINYVSLLKTTQQTDPKAMEYIEVLDRKSQRLKKLTEDLVEASKASTGVLKVEREKLGLSQLIDQALGEWEEKLADRKLMVIKTLPEGETFVYADGRHLWRVIDNLLSNCAKYAMEGTRIYMELIRGHGQATLSIKNISREALNVPPEQLMERFVRGEESRSTEGSGLGLSIARSLTELQGGNFSLTVDGDLFKASITLPQSS